MFTAAWTDAGRLHMVRSHKGLSDTASGIKINYVGFAVFWTCRCIFNEIQTV